MHQKSSLISCDEFLNFFSQKIADQRLKIPIVVMDPSDSPAYSAEWSEFQPINTSILQPIVQNLKPTFCGNDMMPSRLLKQALDCVSSSLMHLINKSLCTGLCPLDFKYAVVSPRLKWPNLAPDEMKTTDLSHSCLLYPKF